MPFRTKTVAFALLALCAVAATFLWYSALFGNRTPVADTGSDPELPVVENEPEVIVRDAEDVNEYVKELREQLAVREDVVPDVVESVLEEDLVIPEDSLITVQAEPQYCNEAGANQIINTIWNRGPVRLTTIDASSSSTGQLILSQPAPYVVEQTLPTMQARLLMIPIAPTNAENTFCIPDTFIGVTADGSLLDNNAAATYYSAPADVLIGFAKDGAPIYGPDADQELDECGGVLDATGYRYHIRTDESAILHCYRGKPFDYLF